TIAAHANARKAPATGLASVVTTLSAPATHHRLRWPASTAARPAASPTAKASRPTARVVTVPAADSSVARRRCENGRAVRRGRGEGRRAKQRGGGVGAPPRGAAGPSRAPGGGSSGLSPRVWCPPYQAMFQIVKPA